MYICSVIVILSSFNLILIWNRTFQKNYQLETSTMGLEAECWSNHIPKVEWLKKLDNNKKFKQKNYKRRIYVSLKYANTGVRILNTETDFVQTLVEIKKPEVWILGLCH